MLEPKFSRNRSRRLRKKLKLDEFKEVGFDFKFTVTANNDIIDKFSDDLIDLVDANGLSLFASSGTNKDDLANFYGHVSGSACKGCNRFDHAPGREPTVYDLETFQEFLNTWWVNHKDFTILHFSELKDVNYGDYED